MSYRKILAIFVSLLVASVGFAQVHSFDRFSQVSDYADSLDNSNELHYIISNGPVSSDGSCSGWNYVYYSPFSNNFTLVAALCDEVRDIVVSTPFSQRLPSQYNILTAPFVNSDTAIWIASAHGGTAFVSSHFDVRTYVAYATFGAVPANPSRRLCIVSYVASIGIDTIYQDHIIDMHTAEYLGMRQTPVISPRGELLHSFRLAANYPNPFNPTTTISYSLHHSAPVNLSVFDVTGRKIQTLVDRQQPAGEYTVTFDGNALSSGTYFYRLESGHDVQVRRMQLTK